MRLFFWWRYLTGKTPWDTGITPPEIISLAERLPPGRALDLGCGTGTTSRYLAERGWGVVGVDFVDLALQKARRRVKAAKLSHRAAFYRGDVTRLTFLAEPFDWVIDIGCFHGVEKTRHADYVEHLARLTRPGALFSLYAHAPRVHNNREIGVTPEQVAQLFAPAFTIESASHGRDKGTGPAASWYMLRRV